MKLAERIEKHLVDFDHYECDSRDEQWGRIAVVEAVLAALDKAGFDIRCRECNGTSMARCSPRCEYFVGRACVEDSGERRCPPCPTCGREMMKPGVPMSMEDIQKCESKYCRETVAQIIDEEDASDE